MRGNRTERQERNKKKLTKKEANARCRSYTSNSTTSNTNDHRPASGWSDRHVDTNAPYMRWEEEYVAKDGVLYRAV